MFSPTPMERVVHKVKLKTTKYFAPHNKKKLNNTDFTIISNNCWGGICYEHFGLPKLSPTIGSFFMADDYLRFIKNLDYYLNLELKFVTLEESAHYQEWKDDPEMKNVPIGKLDDVEIVFFHYKDEETARAKWQRRVSRINKNNLIFKFSQMNNCSILDIQRFIDMELPGKKICFVNSRELSRKSSCCVYYKGFEHDKQIFNDTYYWNKYIDVVNFINYGKIIER